MKLILFGATGMVGQGVLREALLDDGIERVLVVGRHATGQQHAKLRELVHDNLYDLSPLAAELAGYDACIFCLGVSAAGMSEAEYRHVTYDLTLGVARLLAEKCPGMTFVYITGAGTDSTGRSRSMWARVKGETENALLALPFKAAYMFRPGLIQPRHGIKSRTRLYRFIYAGMGWLFPVLKAVAPKHVTTTDRLGRAMIAAARSGAPKPVLATGDINQLAEGAPVS